MYKKLKFHYGVLTLFCVFLFVFMTNVVYAEGEEQYLSIKKYISSDSLRDAYSEILRYEMMSPRIDPALQNLRSNLLDETKRKIQNRIRAEGGDEVDYTVLADIAFQQTDYDNGIIYISKALNLKPDSPASNYVCAKILFRQGNTEQAFNKMEAALKGATQSPVVFDDYQFLYNCKTYGKDTAVRLTKNTDFLKRATPITDQKEDKIPESPFQNDPTKVAVAVRQPKPEPLHTFSDPDEEDKLDEFVLEEDDDFGLEKDKKEIVASNKKVDDSTAKTGQDISIKPKITIEPPEDDDPADFNTLDEFDDEFDKAEDELDKIQNESEFSSSGQKEESPIEKNRLLAESYIAKAEAFFQERDFVMARQQYNEAINIYPNVSDPNNIKGKIAAHFDAIDKHKEALDFFELKDFDNAKHLFEEVYEYDNEAYSDAPFYLAQIYLTEDRPDYDKIIKYLDLSLKYSDSDAEFRKEVRYAKIQVLYEMQKYSEALEMFEALSKDDYKFLSGKDRYRELQIGLYFNKYKIELICLAVLGVLGLIFLFYAATSDHALFKAKDPVELINKAFAKRNFKRIISVGEKALTKEQPIQIEREILEFLVQAYYETKNLDKCQEASRRILENFPENNVAWVYLSKTAIAKNDTSNEAITMYENFYRSNPGNLEYLPILAKHYSKNSIDTPEAMEILYAYYRTSEGENDKDVILTLANGYVKARTLSSEAVNVLENAVKYEDKTEYHELLARNYSKLSRFDEASKECVKVLTKNITNMGIHVVYTSCMKKLYKIPEAILQYNKFMDNYPGNPQLAEIISGLENDLNNASEDGEIVSGNSGGDSSLPDLMALSDINSLAEPDLPAPGNLDLPTNNIVEPNQKDYDFNSLSADVPLPDFSTLTGETENNQTNTVLPSLDVMPGYDEIADSKEETGELEETEQESAELAKEDADNSALPSFDDLQQSIADNKTKSEIPSNLKDNTAYSDEIAGLEPVERKPDVGNVLPTLDPFNLSDSFLNEFAEPVKEVNMNSNASALSNETAKEDLPSVSSEKAKQNKSKTTNYQLQMKMTAAQEAANSGHWDEVIEYLSEEYETTKNKDAGIMIVKARLGQKKPEMANQILEELHYDPEMLTDDIKSVFYDVALALEENDLLKEALKLYDILCNADINYKDVFDRSDSLYAKLK